VPFHKTAFERKGKQMKKLHYVIGMICFAIVVGTGTQARQSSKQPITSKELAGTWRGERSGAKIELVFTNRDDVFWHVDTVRAAKSGMAHAVVEVPMKWVADKQTGTVALRFRSSLRGSMQHPVIEMGRLAFLKRGGGELRLTILPTARAQSNDYYQLVKDFPLVRTKDGQ
jgi:hypothetical protein